MLIGLTIFSNGVLLLIFTAGRLTQEVAPIVPEGLEVPEGAIANPLPQALILTAIVIGFAMFAFFSVLAFRAYQELAVQRLLNHARLARMACFPPGCPIRLDLPALLDVERLAALVEHERRAHQVHAHLRGPDGCGR